MAIDDTVNALIEAVEAIEHELGITPSSVYADVRVRLDILEARINNPNLPSPTVENPFIIGDSGVTIETGTGEPISSPVTGSLYIRQDGYLDNSLYSYRSDGWQSLGGGVLLNLLPLDGYGAGGSAFDLSFTNESFTPVDGTSYDICLRILVVNTTSTPTCARYVYDILAHAEGGSLTVDVANATLVNDNSTGWTTSINAVGNSLVVTVDAVGSDDRRATATLEWRELSRL